MPKKKGSLRCIIVSVLLVFASTFPVLGAETGAETGAAAPSTAGQGAGTAAGEDLSQPATDSGLTSGQEANPAGSAESVQPETTEPAPQPPADSSQPELPAAPAVIAEPVITAAHIRNDRLAVGQEVVIDVTSVLAAGVSQATFSRYAVELTGDNGAVGPDDVAVAAGSEPVALTVQDGLLKGYWTPAVPFSLQSGDAAQVGGSLTFLFKQGGVYDLKIYADDIQYETAAAPQTVNQEPAGGGENPGEATKAANALQDQNANGTPAAKALPESGSGEAAAQDGSAAGANQAGN
jgi:hypothetical protein